MNVPPLIPESALQEGPSPSRGAIPALVEGLFTRRQIRSLTDDVTHFIIKTGGISIILCILGMCVFLVKEVIPLFLPTKATARERHTGSTARYLMGMPLLGDYLEEGAAALGVNLSSSEFDAFYH